jgi:hypothetical protein
MSEDEMTNAQRQYEREWHLDKKVPIALIATLAVQTVVVVWWAASLSARVESLERQALAIAPQAGQIIRLETKVDVINGTLAEIKAILRGHERP